LRVNVSDVFVDTGCSLRRENEEMEGDIMISVSSLCFFRETPLELIGSD